MKITEEMKTQALVFMADMQMAVASRDPKYLEATSKVINEALITPEIETRCWYDNIGEFCLARDTIHNLLGEIEIDGVLAGIKVLRRDDDRERFTMTWELSNGSAIKIGLKQFEYLSKSGG